MREILRLSIVTALLALTALAAPGQASAGSVAEFYKGKQMKMIIRSSPGGGYDTYARLLARHIVNHIPGKPTMIPINMPGGGGIRAANYMLNTAPKDGSILTIVSRGLPMYQAMGGTKFKGDLRKFNWICNLSDSNPLLVTWYKSPVKTISDARKREVIIGATGAGSISVQIPAAYNRLLGTKIKIIYGYNGGSAVNLAMERGEVEGRATNNLASWKATHPEWLAKGKLNFLLQLGLKRDKGLPNVPLLIDLVKGDKEKEEVARFLTLANIVGRPIATNPGVPKERVAALRKACDATFKDKAFIEEALKQRAEMGYMPGEEVQKVVAEVINAPKPLLEKVKLYMKPQGGEAEKRKAKLVKTTSKVVKIKSKGRKLFFKDAKGDETSAKVSGRRTKITIAGKKAKRKNVKVGMVCEVVYEGPGTEAVSLACNP